MKIADSSVQMQASGSYGQYSAGKQVQISKKTGVYSFGELSGGYAGADFSENLYANYNKDGALSRGDAGTGKNSAIRQVTRTVGAPADILGFDFRNNLLALLFSRILPAGAFGGRLTGTGMNFSAGVPAAFGGLTYTRINYQEQEDLSFQAAGQAVTEDGRTIAFDMNILMSRSFVDYTQISVPTIASALMDPLVVNVGAAVADVSDQTFRFDLDADGTEEDVAMLAGGSGFLALDKNGDGVINDGSELFGATSGDGFGDLRQYDSDGNGWIDENDEIFSRLKVWYKNGDGKDELIDLKDADIGAIFLGEQETSFHLTGADNRLNGMLRSTGIFLKESGGVGTIQHVDLATYRDGEEGNGLPEDDTRAVGGENFVSGYGLGDAAAPDVLVVRTGSAGRASDDGRENTRETENAADRRVKAAEERERLKREQRERHAEKKRRNEELIEKAQKRHEEEEARIEELFADRRERREAEEEEAQEARERHLRFERDYAKRRGMDEALSA